MYDRKIEPLIKLQPAKRARLSKGISKQLKNQIYKGVLKPGDRLPSIIDCIQPQELKELEQNILKPFEHGSMRVLIIGGKKNTDRHLNNSYWVVLCEI